MRYIDNFNKSLVLLVLFLLGGMMLQTGCSEDIDESNLYTSRDQTIEDYLATNVRYEYFNRLVTAVGYDKMLSAYGTYTCFAPTNEGVLEYLDSLYEDPVNLANPHNGMTAPAREWLESLQTLEGRAKEQADSLCMDIVLFHLISAKTISIEMDKNNTLNTLINRDIISTVGPDGEILLNGYSTVTMMDVELENGILHEIDHVLRRSNALVANELELHDEFRLFSDAVKLCGLGDTLVKQVRGNLSIPVREQEEYIPTECRLGYTIFAETDEAFEKAGITSLEQLIDSVKKWYGNCKDWYDYARKSDKEISIGTDYRNPWNVLNMFLRYHVTEVKVPYNKLFREHGETNDFIPVEYYETMLPYTLLKINRIANRPVVNRWVDNSSMSDRLAQLASPEVAKVRRHGLTVNNGGYSCLNGYVHPIDGVLCYDDETAHGVLNERIRMDVTSILTELTSNNMRMVTDAELRGMNSGYNGSVSNLGFVGNGNIRIPMDYSEHMYVYNNNETKVFYCSAQDITFANYQGDELNCMGAYDFAIRMPPVPAGMYELRLGYSAYSNRGMVQIYLGRSADLADMVPVDIPLDMRHVPNKDATESNPDPYTGWCDYTKCEDQGLATDQNMRYLGFMRAPMGVQPTSGGKPGTHSLREEYKSLRRILIKQNFEQGEYWLRFKTMLPNNKNTMFHLDYIEFCPENVYNNARYNEDMY